ncbi:MAG: MFS transporter, partial [Steroidobacterales bacterium]
MSSSRRLGGLAVFRHPQLARFVAGRFCMAIGWQMLAVAVGWQIYSFTHDPLALGLVGLAEFAPFVVLVLWGGHVADRAERRVVLLSAFALQCVCIATLLGLTLAGNRASWPVYLTIAVFGAARAFWMPTAQAIVPSLVPREEFRHAVAINASFYQAAIIAGPALGGVLFLLGTPIVYGSCLLLFLVNVALMSSVRPQRVPRQALAA